MKEKENTMKKMNVSTWLRKAPSLKTGMLLAAAAIALAACGGSGASSGGDEGSGPVVLTGQFLDSAVEGLGYETPTQSGTTDSSGSFKYVAGETVKFTLYGQPLSSSIGFSTLTPGDTGVEETDLDRLINQLRFLQTIDTDNDPANGIRLPAISGAFSIDFAQRIEDFESDATVLAFLASHAGGRALVSVEDAVAHFQQSVSQVSNDVVLKFSGKTATSVITNSDCGDARAVQRYAYGPNSVTLTGSDGFITDASGDCYARPDRTEVLPYSIFVPGEFLSCLPDCTYAGLNSLRHGLDGDGRTVIELSWHTPGTQVIRYVKRILHDPQWSNPEVLSTFKETLTFD